MMLGDWSLNQTLQRVVDLAKQVIPRVRDVSVTVLRGQHSRTVVFTGRSGLLLDERQYQSGFGPCMDAAATGKTVTISTKGNNPYMEFSRIALKARITHVVSTPLELPDRVLGAMNLYVVRDQPLHDDLVTLAEMFAGYATAGIANAVLHQNVVDLSRQLQAALASRSVMEQAKGILMAQHRCSSDAAFTKLVQAAQQQHLKVRDAAAAIVAELEVD